MEAAEANQEVRKGTIQIKKVPSPSFVEPDIDQERASNRISEMHEIHIDDIDYNHTLPKIDRELFGSNEGKIRYI